MAKINLLVVDDEKLFAEFITDYLNSLPGFKVVATLYDGSQVIETLSGIKTDIVLLDLSMPRVDGMETIYKIKTENAQVRIIVLTSIVDPTVLKKLINACVDGIITKYTRKEEIVKGILMVSNGGTYYSKEIIAQLTSMPDIQENEIPHHADITGRELQILDLIAQQMTSHEIAEKLVISLRTVETHRRNMMRKLNVKNAAGLIQAASDFKLVKSLNLKTMKQKNVNIS